MAGGDERILNSFVILSVYLTGDALESINGEVLFICIYLLKGNFAIDYLISLIRVGYVELITVANDGRIGKFALRLGFKIKLLFECHAVVG